MLDISLVGGVSSAVITAIIVQVLKPVGIPKRWFPLVSMIIGMIVVVAGTWNLGNIFLGIAIGFSASGGYDVIKKSILNK